MNLISSAQQATMTSREIADLVEARHNDVVVTIRRLFEKGLLRSNRESRQESTGGRPIEVYDLCQRDTLLVAAGYNDELRARVIDRWEELERQVTKRETFSVPQTYAQALLEAGRLAAIVEEKTAQLEAAAPAVEFVSRYVQADGLKGFREVCKILKANESHFRSFLLDNKIMYRLSGTLTAHQQHIDAGRFEVRAGEANEHAYNTTKFTPKGVTWIAGEWAKHNLPKDLDGGHSAR